MTKDGHAVALLSGDLTVEQRIAVLDRFREGKEKVLITTNVLSRGNIMKAYTVLFASFLSSCMAEHMYLLPSGIDVEQVTIVVNFDLPIDLSRKADCETYLHRIGRTGRFGKAGLAINLIDNSESMGVLKQIEQHFGKYRSVFPFYI